MNLNTYVIFFQKLADSYNEMRFPDMSNNTEEKKQNEPMDEYTCCFETEMDEALTVNMAQQDGDLMARYSAQV